MCYLCNFRNATLRKLFLRSKQCSLINYPSATVCYRGSCSSFLRSWWWCDLIRRLCVPRWQRLRTRRPAVSCSGLERGMMGRKWRVVRKTNTFSGECWKTGDGLMSHVSVWSAWGKQVLAYNSTLHIFRRSAQIPVYMLVLSHILAAIYISVNRRTHH
jgi:hypothetical protein